MISYVLILKGDSGHKSDGVVIFEEELFDKAGIDYLRETRGLNHFDAGSQENLEEVKRFINKPIK